MVFLCTFLLFCWISVKLLALHSQRQDRTLHSRVGDVGELRVGRPAVTPVAGALRIHVARFGHVFTAQGAVLYCVQLVLTPCDSKHQPPLRQDQATAHKAPSKHKQPIAVIHLAPSGLASNALSALNRLMVRPTSG